MILKEVNVVILVMATTPKNILLFLSLKVEFLYSNNYRFLSEVKDQKKKQTR